MKLNRITKIGIIKILIIIGGIACLPYNLSAQTPFYGPEVLKHYHLFEAKYHYADCRVWIDYRPIREPGEIDVKTHKILIETITKYNKLMIYSNWKDFGGEPGIHLAFGDFCDQSMELAEKIAVDLAAQAPEIEEAFAVKHSKSRNHLDVGKPFMLYLDDY